MLGCIKLCVHYKPKPHLHAQKPCPYFRFGSIHFEFKDDI